MLRIYIHIAPSKIHWELPETIKIHEEAHGNCTITGSSVTPSNLLYIVYCKYQYNVTVIDQYTVRVNFTIYNATGLCQITCSATDHAETRKLHITNIVNSDTPCTSMSKSTSMITPSPTRTNDITTLTRSQTYTTSSSADIQPTTSVSRLNTTGISQVDVLNTGGDTNSNTGMLIALLLLVMILLIMTTLNLMLNIKKQRSQDSKC